MADFDFEVLKEKITEWTGKAVSKGKAAGDIIKLKSEINSCEGVINRSYSAIGRKYYEMYADGGYDTVFDKQMVDIKNAKKAIKELEDQLEDIKAND